jgi:hypothetical protein
MNGQQHDPTRLFNGRVIYVLREAPRDLAFIPRPQPPAPLHAHPPYHLSVTRDDLLDRIVVDPQICFGKPTIHGTRRLRRAETNRFGQALQKPPQISPSLPDRNDSGHAREPLDGSCFAGKAVAGGW